mgnify:CR=1 FL=1
MDAPGEKEGLKRLEKYAMENIQREKGSRR